MAGFGKPTVSRRNPRHCVVPEGVAGIPRVVIVRVLTRHLKSCHLSKKGLALRPFFDAHVNCLIAVRSPYYNEVILEALSIQPAANS